MMIFLFLLNFPPGVKNHFHLICLVFYLLVTYLFSTVPTLSDYLSITSNAKIPQGVYPSHFFEKLSGASGWASLDWVPLYLQQSCWLGAAFHYWTGLPSLLYRVLFFLGVMFLSWFTPLFLVEHILHGGILRQSVSGPKFRDISKNVFTILTLDWELCWEWKIPSWK